MILSAMENDKPIKVFEIVRNMTWPKEYIYFSLLQIDFSVTDIIHLSVCLSIWLAIYLPSYLSVLVCFRIQLLFKTSC